MFERRYKYYAGRTIWRDFHVNHYIVSDARGAELGEIDWPSESIRLKQIERMSLYERSIPSVVVHRTRKIPPPSADLDWRWRCVFNEDDQVEGRLLFNVGKLERKLLEDKDAARKFPLLMALANQVPRYVRMRVPRRLYGAARRLTKFARIAWSPILAQKTRTKGDHTIRATSLAF